MTQTTSKTVSNASLAIDWTLLTLSSSNAFGSAPATVFHVQIRQFAVNVTEGFTKL